MTESNDTLLRDDIAELRKYHLVASGSDIPRGGTALVVPSGIRLMIDQVKSHVRDPKRLERACSTARASSPQLGTDHGDTINRAIALLRANKADEALELAQIANKKYRDNPDLKCLLGRVHLRTTPPDPRSADIAFRKAHELGCNRAELMSLWIEAKKQLQDWVGLIEVTRLADKRVPVAQNSHTRAHAFETLGDLATNRGDTGGAAKHYIEGVVEINNAFERGQVRGRVPELKDLRDSLLEKYVRIAERSWPDPDEYLNVWLATFEAFKFGLRHPALLKLGAERFQSWWSAVEGRGRDDPKAGTHLRRGVDNLGSMVDKLTAEQWPYSGVLASLQRVKSLLSSKF